MLTRPLPLGRGRFLQPGARTVVMGVLNVTPDSFSDGGHHCRLEEALAAGRRMQEEGACVIDVGGESTRPGAKPVPLQVELDRVLPVVQALVAEVDLPVSVDTRKARVFQAAYQAGASLLNDVSALQYDPAMATTAGETDAAVILMHMRGTPQDMQARARFTNVVEEVAWELSQAVERAAAGGVASERIILDPGLGFAKRCPHNLELLKNLNALRLGSFPLLVGPSRKRFLGEITGRKEPLERDSATVALVALLAGGGVEMVRVHAVGPAADAVAVAEALGLERGEARVFPWT